MITPASTPIALIVGTNLSDIRVVWTAPTIIDDAGLLEDGTPIIAQVSAVPGITTSMSTIPTWLHSSLLCWGRRIMTSLLEDTTERLDTNRGSVGK